METIRTDALPSFQPLSKEAYLHERLRVGTLDQASLKFPWVPTVISNCKGQTQGTQRGVSLKHLARYLSEFCYRFNRHFWEQQLFDRLLTACALTATVYRDNCPGKIISRGRDKAYDSCSQILDGYDPPKLTTFGVPVAQFKIPPPLC